MENSNLTQANENDKQTNTVFNAFFECPKTMMEVAVETSIDRGNICWYIKLLKERNKIQVIGYRKCKITNCDSVGEYSTNPEFFVVLNQLELFDNER